MEAREWGQDLIVLGVTPDVLEGLLWRSSSSTFQGLKFFYEGKSLHCTLYIKSLKCPKQMALEHYLVRVKVNLSEVRCKGEKWGNGIFCPPLRIGGENMYTAGWQEQSRLPRMNFSHSIASGRRRGLRYSSLTKVL